MTATDALLLGLCLGLLLGLAKRLFGAPGGLRAGSRIVVKWQGGIGRASVLEARGGMLLVSSPLMRDSYPAPDPGGELVLKPIGGGKPRRGAYVGDADSSWKLQLK